MYSMSSENEPQEMPVDSTPDPSESEFSQEESEHIFSVLYAQQNLPMGILAGLITSIGSAVAWAAITVAMEYQIGWLAIAVGFIVGYAVRIGGKGISKIFGIVGASLAIIAVLGGNFLSIIGFIANEHNFGYFDVLRSFPYSETFVVMKETFSPIDILFYGLALWEGYRFSFRQITPEMIEDCSPLERTE